MSSADYRVTLLLAAKDELTNSMKAAKKAVRDFTNSTVSNAKKIESKWSNVASFMKDVFAVTVGVSLANVVNDIERFIADSIRNYAEFEAASVKLAAVSTEAWESIGDVAAYYRAEASAAARELGVSANESLQAMEALIKAGLSGADAAQALAASIRLAKLEGIDFATAGNNLVQVMAQFGIKGSEATRVVDVLVNASRLGIGTANDFAQGLANCGASARAMGLSLEDATSWLVVLERRFGSAQEAGTHLNRFFLELYEIAEKLGVPIRDAGGALRNTNDIILDVINAARALGQDFAVLQKRLEGVDMRAVKALFTFTQMGENIEFLREEIEKMNTALQAYDAYMKTMQGQMARTQSEIDAMQRRTGAFFGNLWLSIQQVGLPILEAFGTAWSGIAAKITGQAIPALESWLNAQRLMDRMSDKEIANLLANWAKAGEVILNTGERVKVTASDIARMAENLGVMSDELRAVLTDQKRALDEFFEGLREHGQLTRDVFEGMISYALMMGKINAEQATQLSEKYGFLDDKMRQVIDTFSKMAEASEETGKQFEITADGLVSIARAFDVDAKRAIQLANQMFNLNITYDEHAEYVKILTEQYGLNEDQARQFIDILKQEAEKHKEASNAAKEHAQSLDELRARVMESISGLVNYGRVTGPLADQINRAREAVREFIKAGGNLPSSIMHAIDYIEQLNNQFAQLEQNAKAVAAAQEVAAVGASYYSTIQEIQEALVAEQVLKLKQQIEELRRQEEALRASGDATKRQIEIIKQQRMELEAQLNALQKNTQLTIQQAASQQRLAAIQQTLGLVSQIVAMQQTALQLAMMGATNTSDMFMNAVMLLTGALEDGNITQEEMKQILQSLGVQFDETGKPVINLKDIMEEFRKKVIETKNKVEDFRSTLASLDGMTVHTYHYHHEITVKETKGGGGGSSAKSGEEFGDVPGAQHGAWETREGLYYLHRGEMVLPKDVAEWVRRGSGFGGTIIHAPVRIEVHGSVIGQDLDQLSEEISRRIVRRLRSMM